MVATPSLAEPSPRARPSGERMRRLSMTLPGQIQAHEPGGRGEHSARRHHRPPGRIDCAKLKAAACIPEQMADATAEMQEVTKYATSKDDLTEPRLHEAVHERVRLRPRSRRHQPRDQCDGANAQCDARQPVSERQDGGELRLVDLQVRGERSCGNFDIADPGALAPVNLCARSSFS